MRFSFFLPNISQSSIWQICLCYTLILQGLVIWTFHFSESASNSRFILPIRSKKVCVHAHMHVQTYICNESWGKPHEVTLQSACNFHMVLILHIRVKLKKMWLWKKQSLNRNKKVNKNEVGIEMTETLIQIRSWVKLQAHWQKVRHAWRGGGLLWMAWNGQTQLRTFLSAITMLFTISDMLVFQQNYQVGIFYLWRNLLKSCLILVPSFLPLRNISWLPSVEPAVC